MEYLEKSYMLVFLEQKYTKKTKFYKIGQILQYMVNFQALSNILL